MAGDKITGTYLLQRMDQMEKTILTEVRTSYRELDGRVNKVESFQDRVLGISALLSSFVGLASTYIWKRVVGD